MPQQKLISNGLGQQLCSYWHEPAVEPRGAVIVASAIGISQTYYQSFAAWLAEQGFLAVTFDYCGIGESLQGSLRQVRHSVIDWAQHDCGAVLDEVHRHNHGKPLYWIGHSLGGQIVPFISGNEKISKLITVACGSGYWKGNAPHTRPRALLLWKVLMPVLTPLYGYFPGKRLNIIGDLPPRVAKQWRTWCLNPRYAAGIDAEHQAAYSRFRQPITGLAFVDDEVISAANVQTLHGAFDQAPVQLHFIDPRHYGGTKVGHLGFFRRKQQQPLWDRCLLPELAC
jgi:predicted alpha/beta hydrolase